MPSDLELAKEAVARGDHAEARRRARAVLARGDETDPEQAEAKEIMARLASDRAMLVMLAACAAFFLVVVLLYIGR